MIALPERSMRRTAARSVGGTALRWLALMGVSISVAVLSVSGPVHAQSATAADPVTLLDRAKRDAEKVYEMIRIHSNRPRRASPAANGAASTAPQLVVSEAPPRISSGVAKLVAAPERRAQSMTSRDAAPANVELSAAAPLNATQVSVNQVSLAVAEAGGSVATDSHGTQLVLVTSVEPEFPAQLVRRLGQGSVAVNFEVRPDGSVCATSIQKSRHAGWNEGALAALAAWRFKPVSKATAGVTELRFE